MFTFNTSEIISIVEIIVNIFLAYLLANFIQRNQVNSRTLRDYYISQVNACFYDLKDVLNDLDQDLIKPRDISLKLINLALSTGNLAQAIDTRYKINSQQLVLDILDLQTTVEADVSFAQNYRQNLDTDLEYNTRVTIRTFRGNKLRLFHDLINKINDFKKGYF